MAISPFLDVEDFVDTGIGVDSGNNHVSSAYLKFPAVMGSKSAAVTR